MAEYRAFLRLLAATATVFKTAALNHSATCPA